MGLLDNDEGSWGPLKELMGWTNSSEFEEFQRKIYKPSTHNATEEERWSIIPETLGMDMASMIRLHENVLDLCHEQMRPIA